MRDACETKKVKKKNREPASRGGGDSGGYARKEIARFGKQRGQVLVCRLAIKTRYALQVAKQPEAHTRKSEGKDHLKRAVGVVETWVLVEREMCLGCLDPEGIGVQRQKEREEQENPIPPKEVVPPLRANKQKRTTLKNEPRRLPR